MVVHQMSQMLRTFADTKGTSGGEEKSGERSAKSKTGPLRLSPSSARRAAEFAAYRMSSSITRKSGAILPEPQRTRFGFLRVVASVMIGLFIGASLSKMMANFLEEKELFVPSDDDDDDDD